MKMHIASLSARATQLKSGFMERLEAASLRNHKNKCQKKTDHLLLKYAGHRKLREELGKRIDFDENLAKDLRMFIRLLHCEAVNCEAYEFLGDRSARNVEACASLKREKNKTQIQKN